MKEHPKDLVFIKDKNGNIQSLDPLFCCGETDVDRAVVSTIVWVEAMGGRFVLQDGLPATEAQVRAEIQFLLHHENVMETNFIVVPNVLHWLIDDWSSELDDLDFILIPSLEHGQSTTRTFCLPSLDQDHFVPTAEFTVSDNFVLPKLIDDHFGPVHATNDAKGFAGTSYFSRWKMRMEQVLKSLVAPRSSSEFSGVPDLVQASTHEHEEVDDFLLLHNNNNDDDDMGMEDGEDDDDWALPD